MQYAIAMLSSPGVHTILLGSDLLSQSMPDHFLWLSHESRSLNRAETKQPPPEELQMT